MKKYIPISDRRIEFNSITEEDFFHSSDEMAYMAQDAEQIASHPLSNMYTTNLRWALTSFNLFEFHTNFPITEQTLQAIEAVPGIESISQYTKYRGIVAIGKLFNQEDTKQCVRRQLTETFKKQNERIEPLLNAPEPEEQEEQPEEEA